MVIMKTQCMHSDSSVSPTGKSIACDHFFHSFGDQVHLQFYGARIPNICKHLVKMCIPLVVSV